MLHENLKKLNIRIMRFDQSFPVSAISESRGGPLSVTEDKWRTNKRKSLCLVLDTSLFTGSKQQDKLGEKR